MPDTVPSPPEASFTVTVVLLTYNHESFIAQAIESVLMQTTDFPWEIVIVEDCSTDDTRTIVEAYRDRFSAQIRLVLAEKNRNDNRAWGQSIVNARGKYVALLDGDDYWTSPAKLQKQVEFLDRHPDCSICFHNARIVHEDTNRAPGHHNEPDQKEFSTIEDLWRRNFIATCSAMLRNGLLSDLPEWFHRLRFGDWPLYILLAQHGRIGYLDEVMAVYRIHARSLFGGAHPVRQLEQVVAFYDDMLKHFSREHRAAITSAKARHAYALAEAYVSEGNKTAARRAFATALLSRSFRRDIDLREAFPLFSHLFLPRMFR